MKRRLPLFFLRLGLCLIALFCAVTLNAQIAQDHPELCGRSVGDTGPVIPPGVMVESDSSTAQSDLILAHEKTTVRIRIPGAMSDVREVCPLSGNRVLIFGLASPSLYNIVLADVTARRIVDSFYGFSPVISPNQNWLMMRKFYPASVRATISEEYLLYDLSSRPRENRADEVIPTDTASVGRPVYPIGQRNLPWDNIGVPDSQVHEFRSRSFFWDPDDGAVVFADSVQNALSIVFIVIKKDGKHAAYVHAVQNVEVCLANDISSVMLSDVKFNRSQTSPLSIEVELTSDRPGCNSRILSLHPEDFTPATIEKHVRQHGKPSILKE